MKLLLYWAGLIIFMLTPQIMLDSYFKNFTGTLFAVGFVAGGLFNTIYDYFTHIKKCYCLPRNLVDKAMREHDEQSDKAV